VKPILIKTKHEADTYDEKFMDVIEAEYSSMTRHMRMRLDNVRLLVDPHPGDRVHDIGCATGAMAHYLSTFGCVASGSDIAEAGVERARSLYPGLEFDVADAAALPYEDGSFDKIVAADITEHLPDEVLAGMCSECFRVLVRGGTLSVHTPNPRHFFERMKQRDFLLEQNPTHIGLRTMGELRAALEHAGFEIELAVMRPGFLPGLRQLELVLGRFWSLFQYRICIRARRPR
jgi:SAM-dependent methyltransferase